MAFTSITSITAAGDPQTSSGSTETTCESGKLAIDICMNAWSRAHDKQAEKAGSTGWDCRHAGNKAYLKAAPPLSGYKNICDFIACINYASMTGVIIHKDAAHFLVNAKIALSTIYHQPKPIGDRNPVGRPKSSGKSEN